MPHRVTRSRAIGGHQEVDGRDAPFVDPSFPPVAKDLLVTEGLDRVDEVRAAEDMRWYAEVR
jgi:hypothetical protein